MQTKWSNEELDYLKNNYPKLGAEKCSIYLDRSIVSVKSKASRLKISSEKSWTKEEDDFLLENYGKLTIREILKTLTKRTYISISSRANKKFGLKTNRHEIFQLRKRKNSFNEDFFENINILNSYWAGFIAADGWVRKNQIGIKLSKKDKNHLLKLKKELNFSGKLKDLTIKKNNKNYKYSTLYFFSRKTTNDIKFNFNIIPNKSLILEPPTLINNDCKLAFICGLLDGDGSIIIYKKKHISIKFLGTEKMLKWVKNVLLNYIDIKDNSLSKNANIYSFSFSKKENVIEFYDLIKKYNLPLLQRKWKKLKNFK